MQMGNGLAAVGTVVDRYAETAVRDPFVSRYFTGRKQEVPERFFVTVTRFSYAGDHFFWHY